MLTWKDVEELISIHEKETGEVLSRDEARAMGENLLRLCLLLRKSGKGEPGGNEE